MDARKEHAMNVRQFLHQRYAPFRELDSKSITSYALTISRWGEFLGREPELSDFTNDAMTAFLHHRSSTPRKGRTPSARTVQREAKSLCSIWNFAARRRELRDMEFPIIKRKRPPEKIVMAYSAADIQRLLTACVNRRGTIDGKPASWWWATLIYTMFLCGSRITETLSLRWGDIDMDACRIRFRAETRKGKTRDIERDIRPELVAMLRRHVGSADALVWDWRPRQPNSIYPSLRGLCKQAGVVYLKFHGLRKSSASFVQASGADASAHMDHSSPSITKEFYLAPSIVGRSSVVGLLPQMVLPALGADDVAEFVPEAETA
jgi:integrase